MTEAHRPEPDVLPPEPGGALSVPPPVPQKNRPPSAPVRKNAPPVR